MLIQCKVSAYTRTVSIYFIHQIYLAPEELFQVFLLQASTYKVAGENGTYINGIADLSAAGIPALSILGNIDPSNPGIQTLFNAAPGSMNLGVQTNVTGGISPNMNLSVGAPDSSSNTNLSTSGINFSHDLHNIGNSNMALKDSSITQNVYEYVNSFRRSSINMMPDDYNVYGDNDDPSANTHSGSKLTSTSSSQAINDNNLHLGSFLEQQVGELKSNINDNATNNTQIGFDIQKSNSQFFNNDNALHNTAAYNLTNNSFSVHVNRTDNDTTTV